MITIYYYEINMNAQIFFVNRNYINQYIFYSIQYVAMTINLINSDIKLISLDQSSIQFFHIWGHILIM
jgi:hypothetical protein